jgi:hypothetical protein
MNRTALGLAVGAGYFLGRTKKLKLAFAVGTLVAGKRMNLTPKGIADLVSQQLRDNPQFKEIGDQLREDLRGVGKAASGALVERQIEGLADRLHGRTAEVRDQLAGVVPDMPGLGDEEEENEAAKPDDEYEEYDADDGSENDGPEEKAPPRKKAPARKAPAKKATEQRTSAKKAPAKKAAKKTVAKKAPSKKSATSKPAARRATRSRLTRGGGDDD